MWLQIIWNEEPGGNVEHVEEHSLTTEDVEAVLLSPERSGKSRSSGSRACSVTRPTGVTSSSSTSRSTKTRFIQ